MFISKVQAQRTFGNLTLASQHDWLTCSGTCGQGKRMEEYIRVSNERRTLFALQLHARSQTKMEEKTLPFIQRESSDFIIFVCLRKHKNSSTLPLYRCLLLNASVLVKFSSFFFSKGTHCTKIHNKSKTHYHKLHYTIIQQIESITKDKD